MTRLPLSFSDLHDIANALEPIELLPALVGNPVIGRIEVLRPGGGDVVGHFERADGFDPSDEWLGFVPLAEEPGE